MYTTDLNMLAAAAEQNQAGNELFKSLLLQQRPDEIDELVLQLNAEISPQIDCTQCGNCCRSLMINVETGDAERLAVHLQINVEDFERKYIERSSSGSLSVMNTIPCHFLAGNKCSVYAARPNECREFPGLHRPGFTARLFATFMHYGRCPIIYNVIEQLKLKMDFTG